MIFIEPQNCRTHINHKTRINKFSGIKITQSIFFDYNVSKFKINSNIFKETSDTWKLKKIGTFLGGPGAKTLCSQCRGSRIQSLVREVYSTFCNLRSRMPQQKSKIPCATTEPGHRQLNKIFLKEYITKQSRGQRINHKEIIKHFNLKDNKIIKCQNLWNTAKAMLWENFITLHTDIRIEKRFKIIVWGTSLVVRWLRIHLLMQGTVVQSLV